jgi:hypothetical protein
VNCIKAFGVFLYLEFRREILLCVRDIVVRVLFAREGQCSRPDAVVVANIVLCEVRALSKE